MRLQIASMTVVAAALASGCGGGGRGMVGPMGASGIGIGVLPGAPTFMSVSPHGGAAGVATNTTIEFAFGTGMGPGMEQYVDLHQGGPDGTIVPMSCAWSSARTSLTCSPHEQLRSHTPYWIHLGGGMRTGRGNPVGFGPYGPMYGGQWVSAPMMGGSHAGHPWGTMAPGWRHEDGSYGLGFT